MSKTSINSILLYRYFCKNIDVTFNRTMFKEALRRGIGHDEGKREKFIQLYLQMKKHIDKENELLESYNINIIRDSRREIEAVAKRVGLEI
jgi:hypothetical protein